LREKNAHAPTFYSLLHQMPSLNSSAKLMQFYPAHDAGLTFGELPRVYPGVRGCWNTLFLNPGVTPGDSRIMPGLALLL